MCMVFFLVFDRYRHFKLNTQDSILIGLASPWHVTKEEEVIRNLETSLEGLSSEEANLRLTKFGYNELKKRKKTSVLQIFSDQFRNIFVLMLIGAIIISVIIGFSEMQAAAEPHVVLETYVDAIAIGVIVLRARAPLSYRFPF